VRSLRARPIFSPSTHKFTSSVKEFVAYADQPGKLSLGFAQARCRNSSPNISIACTGSISQRAVPRRRSWSRHAGRPHSCLLADARGSAAAHSRGQIKALATSSPERNPDLPDVPTMTELGLAELAGILGRGVGVNRSSADIVDKLNAAINEALQSPEMIASMKSSASSPELARRRISLLLSRRNSALTAVVKASR
jgi:hypothetical protein